MLQLKKIENEEYLQNGSEYLVITTCGKWCANLKLLVIWHTDCFVCDDDILYLEDTQEIYEFINV